jgi:hypothetical protein
MAVHNVLSLLANSKGNLEHVGCFFQQRLDLRRKIHRILVITCLGEVNRAPCALVCVIDRLATLVKVLSMLLSVSLRMLASW